jgi:DNA-binding MarR family transcriptional regulator
MSAPQVTARRGSGPSGGSPRISTLTCVPLPGAILASEVAWLTGEGTALNETEIALAAWVQSGQNKITDQKTYMHAVATARYVIRKIVRIVDDAARDHGFDPLAHQALIQIYGATGEPLAVNQLAERLDVVPAFASRLVRDLEGRGLVERRRTDQDRRMTRVVATEAAGPVLAEINEQVQAHAALFHRQLGDDQRQAALVVLAFFVGIKIESPVGATLRAGLTVPKPSNPNGGAGDAGGTEARRARSHASA